MNYLDNYLIHESLIESLKRQNTKEIAEVIDRVLPKYNSIIPRVLIYPVIDELPSDLVDALAVQLHCDFYDYKLSLRQRREIVKQSIAWHRIKGTPAAVEMLCRVLFKNSSTKEWYEYGGDPYFFRMVMDISDGTEDASREVIQLLKKAIEAGKNVRSWLELLEFVIHLEDTEKVEEIFNADISLYFHDLIPYGTNSPYYTRDGTLVHGHAARRNGHFLHGGRGMEKLYPRIIPPSHQGREDISTDNLKYWPVWIGKETIQLKETLPEELGMSLAISEAAGRAGESILLPTFLNFHEVFPYGTEGSPFSHDGSIYHSSAMKRNGQFARGGTGAHGWPPAYREERGKKSDLDHDRMRIYAIGCSFREEARKAGEAAKASLSLPLPADKASAKAGEMPLTAGLVLRRDGCVRHNGRYMRGVNSCASGDFELVRERRDGRFSRGGSIVHRDSAVACFAR